jgi:hypothetical protein
MNKIYPVVSHKGFVVGHNVETQDVIAPMPQRWMQQRSEARKTQPGVTANQWTSLSAMIAYAANQSGQSEYRVERNLSDRFNIPNAKCLPSNDFDSALRYLADILPA